MADITGQLSQIQNVALFSEAAIKYAEMATALGKELPIAYGYMSEWDWFVDVDPCVFVQPTDSVKLTEYTEVKALVQKPDVTEQERGRIKAFYNGLSKSQFDASKHTLSDKAWSGFKNYKVTWPHPFFKQFGANIVGWPNTLAEDPRRSGKLLVLKDAASSMEWLIENSYKYGFVWYGPTNDTFLYVGQAAAFSEDFKNAAAMGLKAPIYQFFKQAKGKAPASKQELADWINSLPTDGYGSQPRSKLANTWIAWDVIMEEM